MNHSIQNNATVKTTWYQVSNYILMMVLQKQN